MKAKITFYLALVFLVYTFAEKSYGSSIKNYAFSQTAGSYTELTGGTVFVSGDFNNAVSDPIPIPQFAFNGILYTELYITANGFITFGGAPTPTLILPISTAAVTFSGGAVSAFGRNLASSETGTPEIRYEQVGNEFVVQWKDVRRSGVAGEIVSFQVRLNTSNNNIRVVYGGTITQGSSTLYPQVGLRGETNTFATNVNNRTIAAAGGDWINSNPGTLNSSTMYFNSATPGTVPSAGLTFEWAAPNFPPNISYTPLPNTSNTGNRPLNDVDIYDSDGTIAGGALAPRVYWRVNAGSWQSAATSSGSTPYDFLIGTAGLSIGDNIEYFIVAQDNMGLVAANPSDGFSATDVNTITTYPTTPNSYLITEAPLAGDYTIGVVLFRQLSGKDITFERRVRTVVKEEYQNESYLNPEKFERGIESDRDVASDIHVTYSYQEEYYVPILNGVEYTGPLYHEYTPQEKSMYDLRGSGVYATITEAKNDLVLRGISANVRLILLDATYPSETFPIVIGAVNGTDASTSVTLCPGVGVTTTITGSINLPLFDFDGCEYFIIDGRQDAMGSTISMTINNSSTASISSCVRFINGGAFNVLQYVNFVGAGTTSTTRIVDFSTSVSNPIGNSSNLITQCNMSGTRYGIYFSGTAINPNSGNVISHNTMIDGVFSQFFFSSNSNGTTIEHNEIYHTDLITATGTNSALQVNAGNFGENIVRKNIIYNLRNTAGLIRGIYLIGSGEGSTWHIENNFISMTLDNGTKTTMDAISFGGANDYTANVFYNSVRIGGNNGSGGAAGNIVSSGLFKNTSNSDFTLNVKNNIFFNERTGGNAGVVHAGANYNNLAGTWDVNHNCYFSNGGPENAQVRWGGVDYNDLTTYKTAVDPQEQNSMFKAVNFVSNIDLHLTGASVGDLDLSGTPIPGITTDIDGNLRDQFVPYMGANEGAIPLPVDLLYFNAAVYSRDVNLSWATAWEENNDRFEIMRKNFNSEISVWTKVGTVNGAGTTYETTIYSFTDRNLLTGSYEYKLVQYDFNGNSSADFDLNQVVEIGTPSRFELSQNHPNPFNPVTKIGYDIPIESFVKLAIYDMSGREVAVLVNNDVTPGYYTAEFDGANFASGVYFYRLVTNHSTITKRMVLLK